MRTTRGWPPAPQHDCSGRRMGARQAVGQPARPQSSGSNISNTNRRDRRARAPQGARSGPMFARSPWRQGPHHMDKSNKMLIDATHPEETRVVVLRNGRVEEFDYESAARKPLRGNIYLAKVTRVEPSLQAAFVDYGGNRHGFLAFSEIHPDYYQIPVADRQALIAQEERDQRAADADADNRAGRRGRHRHRGAGRHRDRDVMRSEPLPSGEVAQEGAD